jgi:phosphoribosylaminoimidazole-succinocarboxamide synthase
LSEGQVFRAGDLLYEGKAKRVHLMEDPDLVWVEYKDDATAFDGKKRGTIRDKGYFCAQVSVIFFRLLEESGVRTHFVAAAGERAVVCRRLAILPIEVVVRNVVAGSLAKRTGLPEGTALPAAVVELYYKNDELGDPLLNDEHVAALRLATPAQVAELKRTALRVNGVLRAFLSPRGLNLIDFKLEFGLHQGTVLLGDEISPDTCRFWDAKTHEKLDKDRFRRDLGGVEDAYAEVLRRVSSGPVAGAQGAAVGAPGADAGAAGGSRRWLARVFVSLKRTVLDPQGRAVLGALEALGYGGGGGGDAGAGGAGAGVGGDRSAVRPDRVRVDDARVGKYMELSLSAASEDEARARVDDMCRRLLANPVIEEYRFELERAQ